MTGVLPVGPRLEERARAERHARRVALLRRLGWVLAAVAPFAVTAWVLLGSPWLTVDRVEVRGQSRLSTSQVLAAVHVDKGTPLARVDTGAVAARVRALGPVASVSVTRAWPHTLRVTVVEREPVVARRVSAKSWTLYDGTGAQLGTATSLPTGLVQLDVAHPGSDDPSTRAALQVLQGLPEALRSQVVAVRAATPEQVVLVLGDRRRAIWGGVDDGSAKAAALTALLRMKGHVFDVSSPSVVTRR